MNRIDIKTVTRIEVKFLDVCLRFLRTSKLVNCFNILINLV